MNISRNTALLILGLVLTAIIASTYYIIRTEKNSQCPNPNMVWHDGLSYENVYAYADKIEKCVSVGRDVTIYLTNGGGQLQEAELFFDLMRTTTLYEHLTIIAAGDVSSAGNILLLSAKNRYGLPCTSYLWHTSTQTGGTARERETLRLFNIKITKVIFEEAVSTKTAKLWVSYLSGKRKSDFLTSKEALEIGLITHIIPYHHTEVTE